MNGLGIHSDTLDRTENMLKISYAVNTHAPAAGQKCGFKDDRETAGYTAAQKETADRARKIIMANLERHITIAELAQTLHVSATQIKSCFSKVYGMPVYAYARSQRMQAATGLLSETEESVLEIAGKFGYENGSKFARAFRAVMGVSPSQYRRRLQWEKENQAQTAEAERKSALFSEEN